MTTLPFHSSCDKGFFTQSKLPADQENSDSNTSVSARTGIPVEPNRCLPALARGVCRKTVCLKCSWGYYSPKIFTSMKSGGFFLPLHRFFFFQFGAKPVFELLKDEHILFFCMHIYNKITSIKISSQIWQKNKDMFSNYPTGSFLLFEGFYHEMPLKRLFPFKIFIISLIILIILYAVINTDQP